jgi:hypothetical protein
MPTAFCSLEEAYGGDWTKPSNNNLRRKVSNNVSQNRNIEEMTDKPVILKQTQNSNQQISDTPVLKTNANANINANANANANINSNFDTNNDIRSFCPNCASCKEANDVFQQKIINQTIWPRPQWIPQVPNAYMQHNPYDRYWSNVNQIDQREDFTNGIFDKTDFTDVLLKIIILILLVFFTVQLADLIISKNIKE